MPDVRRALAALLWLAAASAAAERPILYPADLGATCVDVSGYPAELRAAYEDIVVTKCAICHTPARVLYSPLLELPPDEAAAFTRAHPAETADPRVLAVRPKAFVGYLKQMWQRPPCCSLCPVFSKAEISAVWKFLVYDAKVRKTGDRLAEFVTVRKALIQRFDRLEETEERHANADDGHAAAGRGDRGGGD